MWGERLLTFAKLAGLVRINIKNPPGIISRASRLLIAEHIISEAGSDFNYYNEIVNKREFADSVLGVIAELKHSNIPPRALHSSISKLRHSVFKSKMEDICKIYSEYDNKLKALHLGDDIDELRLIIERADNKLLQNCVANIKRLIVFGFTEFTETQMEVLKSIYENKIDVEIIEYDIQSSNNNDISLTAFDSIVDESKHCVDKINRLMESQNVNPSKIAVISKSNYGNSQIINVQFKTSGLEFSESTRARLITSHIGKLVLSIFKIKLSDFKKKSLFEFLRNPYVINYFGDSEKYNEYVSDLELLFLSHRMTGGFSSWSANTNIGKLRHSKKYSSVLVALIQKIRSAFNSNKVSVLINDLLNVLELTAFDRLNENE
ncbi:MAG: hypothetical protein GTN99_11600, partial [Candidatus Dadabacteria bacterium]|nr:hypothetical protein [Candidatus Dadabacteria bacterium]NIT14845.1 hypothetical protein [Candidatus Dadabacteria bacterium]